MFLHFVHSNSNRSLTQSGTGRPSPVTPRTSPCTLCTSRLSSVMSTLVSRVAVQANISQYLLPHCECNCPRLWMTSKLSCYNVNIGKSWCSQCWQSILPQCERHCPLTLNYIFIYLFNLDFHAMSMRKPRSMLKLSAVAACWARNFFEIT